MRFELLERCHEEDGPVHRLDPRLKLLAALGFIIVVVATPVGWWRLLAAEGLVVAFVVGLSGVSPRELLARWFSGFLLVAFLAVLIAPAHPMRAELGLAATLFAILARNSLAFLAMLVLVSVTPFRKLLLAMRRLGMPMVMVATLQFMYRYLHVLADEVDRMMKARRSRSFHRSGQLDWGLLTGLIGVLFIRALERGERVHDAMIARGWNGTIRTLDDDL